jgi:hypothetical protein
LSLDVEHCRLDVVDGRAADGRLIAARIGAARVLIRHDTLTVVQARAIGVGQHIEPFGASLLAELTAGGAIVGNRGPIVATRSEPSSKRQGHTQREHPPGSTKI